MTDPSKRDFDAAASTWDSVPARIELAEAVTEAILDRIPVMPDMDALDYGAGTGLLTLGLAPHLASITAADSSSGMLAQLKKKIAESGLKGVRTLLLDLERDPPPDDEFDLVVSAMTLHHIENVPAVIESLAGMVAPEGWLAVADLDPDDGEFHADPAGVRHHGFERKKIARLFKDCELEDVTHETAHTIEKPVEGKGVREFTVFLVTGCKPF